MEDAARTQALQILSDFNLVVDRRGENLLQAAGKREHLCVCRILCHDAAPGSVAGMHSVFLHSMKEVKVTVTYKVSPICPPGLFPQFLAQQIVARRHSSETYLPEISPAGLFMQIKDLANNKQKMLIELHPNDSSIVVKCSSLGLLRDACCTLEGTVSSLFPGLSLSVKVLFPNKKGDRDQFVWDIYGNMVDGHSFGQILEQKRWDSIMDCIEPVTHGAQDSEGNVRSKGTLKYTPKFSAFPKCKLRSILEPTLGLKASFFLSHSWGDKSKSSGFTKRLVRMLEKVSSELVWYDSEQLSDVNHFHIKMKQSIENAQCIIIFLSRVYLSRQNCLSELMWAWKQFKLNGKQLIILPVDSALTLEALAEWAKDRRNLEVDGSGAREPFTIHHSTIKFVSKKLTGFKFRTEWQDDSATDEQRWEAVLEIAKERPSPLRYKYRKNVKMECKTDNGTWLLADLGEEELPENFSSTGTKGRSKRATTTPTHAATHTGTISRSQTPAGVGGSNNAGTVVNDDARSKNVGYGGDASEAMEVVNESSTEGLPSKKPYIWAFFCKKTANQQEMITQIKNMENNPEIYKEMFSEEMRIMVKQNLDPIDVHKEAEMLMMGYSHCRSLFEVFIHPQTSFQKFQNCMHDAEGKNVRVLHFAGHGSQSGFIWLSEQSSHEYDVTDPKDFVSIIATVSAGNGPSRGHTVECVFLNACNTENIGRMLRQQSCKIPYVVCWQSRVDDVTAMQFSKDFYKGSDTPPQSTPDYNRAFEKAAARMPWEMMEGTRNCPYLLSKDGDIYRHKEGGIRILHPNKYFDNDGSARSDDEEVKDPFSEEGCFFRSILWCI